MILVYLKINTNQVYRRSHNRKKLEKPWEGPYVVIKSLGDVVYQVTDKRKAVVLHHDMLKPYTSEFVPNWARKLSKQITSRSLTLPPNNITITVV